ncbi:MAG: TrkA family potassium uptake protein [Desulfovibrionaceae bacterium]|nr:TrkA family potassium uptake protein [Desulfovibrionaceae bacterium]
MNLFVKADHPAYAIIVGCGRLGATLADALSEAGGDVVILDRNKAAFRRLSPSFGGLTVEGDGTSPDILREAGIERADTVVAVTNSDNVNIMIAQLAREYFHVRRVISRLFDPKRECVYQEFGIDTVCPVLLSAREISRLLNMEAK